MSVILTLNGGSSSLKFSAHVVDDKLTRLASGQVQNLGAAATLEARFGNRRERRELGAVDHRAALTALFDCFDESLVGHAVVAVGHRIVHGGSAFTEPVSLDDATLDRLAALTPLAPLHQPHNVATARAAARAFPDALQIGCFDTAFHSRQSRLHTTFALPRAFYDAGIRRYGFHGLSCESIVNSLRRRHPALASGRVIVAHLGNGASMCAMRDGSSVSSTMGLSPLDGLPMGTRCGQIDPGALLYLLDAKGVSVADLTRLLYHESGLLGLSGESHDMRTLEASNRGDAALAIDYFAARVRRETGALTAVLGGLDALVFTGGIGEHSATLRARVCDELGWLGVAIDAERNASHAERLNERSPAVLVMPTDEERVIAEHVLVRLCGDASG